MTLEHGRTRYTRGCRCAVCKAAERDYQRNRYRLRRSMLADGPEGARLNASRADSERKAGPVEAGVEAEIAGLAVDRPGLAQAALALARVMDNPRAVSTQPAAAKALAGLLDKLGSDSARRRRNGLAAVREMTTRSSGGGVTGGAGFASTSSMKGGA